MTENLLYEGKAKKVFTTDEPDVLLHAYKDDATAFNAKKRGSWEGKGKTNATISAALFSYLEQHGVPTHFIEQVDETTVKTKRLEMLPVEVIVRNLAAGSITRLLGFEEGRRFKAPIVELCYKNDDLGDPLVNWHHLRELGVSDEDLEFCEELGLKVNSILAPFFRERGITLVDFKIEVGKDRDGQAMLADEISPDTCRFWDAGTNEKLDKDRFRNDLGGVAEAYAEMLRRVTGC
ncbi:purC: phosphoribosylaminoimidazolesuccinocarboxamide synthase [Rubrobacter radiotolerans]|uniref:Phosphoribosylaminoimidazole-succinocarboxamide synthase n=1 Tax=Rubrobacter radiotolerans TaxID=42256 RepID=A0A023X2G6_RUBRA|nr:phosphoribosylaminoimidazolesuccinocarboxamide synthase [Rubrobacter radiotolerans]AHY46190.1 purC: phosphoribosylaminoimidazolesuccinocarboxamide synthase [Rubrobacter radiotolerans]MDX5893599.1 phosphoribosylaminoimidazolesuccinocarboxamide synthase [Rubrobacter radiotolerans]SMC04084.1 phosphoribosylaminoimidazole-succinocarboxamide synthase [Rubrobacter radiotolerans DSM 5868]